MEVQTKKQNNLLQILQAPVRTSGGFKHIKELLIIELCIEHLISSASSRTVHV